MFRLLSFFSPPVPYFIGPPAAASTWHNPTLTNLPQLSSASACTCMSCTCMSYVYVIISSCLVFLFSFVIFGSKGGQGQYLTGFPYVSRFRYTFTCVLWNISSAHHSAMICIHAHHCWSPESPVWLHICACFMSVSFGTQA